MRRPGWLSLLLDQDYVAYSHVNSQGDSKILAELMSLGLVKITTNKSKRRIVVINKDQFLVWADANYPILETPEVELLFVKLRAAAHQLITATEPQLITATAHR